MGHQHLHGERKTEQAGRCVTNLNPRHSIVQNAGPQSRDKPMLLREMQQKVCAEKLPSKNQTSEVG